jgi:hypothetical protein
MLRHRSLNAGRGPQVISLLVGNAEGRRGMTLGTYLSGSTNPSCERVSRRGGCPSRPPLHARHDGALGRQDGVALGRRAGLSLCGLGALTGTLKQPCSKRARQGPYSFDGPPQVPLESRLCRFLSRGSFTLRVRLLVETRRAGGRGSDK